jgi:hypothetical protein
MACGEAFDGLIAGSQTLNCITRRAQKRCEIISGIFIVVYD